MRKLSLELDELAVESFETAAVQALRGTVDGHVVSMQPGQCVTDEDLSCGGSCPHAGTCGENSCQESCYASCAGTCGSTCGADTCDYTCDNGATCYGAAC